MRHISGSGSVERDEDVEAASAPLLDQPRSCRVPFARWTRSSPAARAARRAQGAPASLRRDLLPALHPALAG